MPAIRLFGRRTLLGGDDLQPASFLTVSLRLVQLFLFLIPIFVHISFEIQQNGGFQTLLYDASDEGSCRKSFAFALVLLIYAVASAVHVIATIILEWRISFWASQGTPTQTEPRNSKVGPLLEVKLVPLSIILFLIWVTGMTAVGLAPAYYSCKSQDATNYSPTGLRYWWVALAFFLLSQVAELVMTAMFLLALYGQPSHPIRALLLDGETGGPDYHNLVEEMWAERCSSACHCLSVASCFAFGGRELGMAEFGDVARALADYLETRGVLDIVPSDIAAGLLVLQKLQKRIRRQTRRTVVEAASSMESQDESSSARSGSTDELFPLGPSPTASRPRPSSRPSQFRLDASDIERLSRSVLSRSSAVDMASLEEGARYAKYALAIYTWVLYLYVHPFSGLPRLICGGGCLLCDCSHDSSSASPTLPQSSPHLGDVLLRRMGRIEGDNLCQMHKKSLLLTAGIKEGQLVYAHLKNGFGDTPYCILLDHEWKSVVLSIRGTFSLEDCVTDVLIEPESMDALGREFGFDGSNQYCHGGVLACVRNVYRDLQRHGLLEALLLGEQALYGDYTLRLVGHSLGAATCTILSYVLRPSFPTVRCVNYSPPGCTLTWELATACNDWCTSFVLDTDLVPRLSRESMESLRDEVLELIPRIKVPKIALAPLLVKGSFHRVDDLLYPEDQVPASSFREQLERFKTIQNERRSSRGMIRDVKLFPPGKIVHLVKTGERRVFLHGVAKWLTCFTTNLGFQYRPVWIGNDELNEIVVSSTMGTNHFPNRIRFMLEQVAEDYGLVDW